MRCSLAIAVVFALILPASAAGAVKTGLDRHAGMRLTLDGRVLTAKIASGRGGDLRLQRRLYGNPIDAICSPSFYPKRSELQRRTQLWPVGARRVSFRFDRDISRRVKWCLIEHDAADIASVMYIRREPIRFVGKGRGPYHSWWRLGAGTGVIGEPCVFLRIRYASTRWCFSRFAERRVTLGVQQWETCDGNAYFFGVASPRATDVRVVLADGTSTRANLYDPPQGSELRARFFADALPGVTEVRSVRSLDAAGAVLAERRVPELAGPVCP